jgi:hypothetical protein
MMMKRNARELRKLLKDPQALLNLDVLLDYLMEQWQTDERPADVIRTLCELHWPGRQFEIAEDDQAEDNLYCLSDAFDLDTGETAEELLREEFRDGTFPRYCRPLIPGLIQVQVEAERTTQAQG